MSSVVRHPESTRQTGPSKFSRTIKFSELGRVVVGATRESEGEHELVVRFSVYDTGVGISEEEGALHFQPFMQAEGTISRR